MSFDENPDVPDLAGDMGGDDVPQDNADDATWAEDVPNAKGKAWGKAGKGSKGSKGGKGSYGKAGKGSKPWDYPSDEWDSPGAYSKGGKGGKPWDYPLDEWDSPGAYSNGCKGGKPWDYQSGQVFMPSYLSGGPKGHGRHETIDMEIRRLREENELLRAEARRLRGEDGPPGKGGHTPGQPFWMGAIARKRRQELVQEGRLPPDPHNGKGCGPPPGYRPPGPPPPDWRPPATKKPTKPQSAVPPNAVRWITLDEASPLVQQGLPALAPAVIYDVNLMELFSSWAHIFGLLSDGGLEVELTHDQDWEVHPEVGEALKEASGQEECICIATCPAQGKWAVGAASNWKRREQAARLALCVALAANAEDLSMLSVRYPEFAQLCESAGIMTDSLDPEAAARAASTIAAEEATWKSKKRRKKAATTGEEEGDEQQQQQELPYTDGLEPPPVAATDGQLPRDAPFWITLAPDGVPDLIEVLSMDALAVTTDGTHRKGLYSCADSVVAALAGEHLADVQYHDDSEWKEFPGVGAALKQVANSEECMCLAVCLPKIAWAVGVGSKRKNRMQAAKLALATTMALQAVDVGEEVDYSELQNFEAFVEEARAARSKALGF